MWRAFPVFVLLVALSAPAFGACSPHLLPDYEPRMLRDRNRPGAAVLPAKSVLLPEQRLGWRRLIQNTPSAEHHRGFYRLEFSRGEVAVTFMTGTVLLEGTGTFGVEPYVWSALERDLPTGLVDSLRVFLARVERVLIQPEMPDRATDIVLHPQNEVMVQVWTEARQFSEALAGHSHSDGFNVLACELGCATLVRSGGSHERGPVVPAPPWLALWRAWHRTPDPNRGPRLILSASIAGHFWPR